jgi:hypothetical protein
MRCLGDARGVGVGVGGVEAGYVDGLGPGGGGGGVGEGGSRVGGEREGGECGVRGGEGRDGAGERVVARDELAAVSDDDGVIWGAGVADGDKVEEKEDFEERGRGERHCTRCL